MILVEYPESKRNLQHLPEAAPVRRSHRPISADADGGAVRDARSGLSSPMAAI